MIVYNKTPIGKAHYLDKDTGDKYRRIVGGIGFPKKMMEGCGLILAENFDEPPRFKVLTTVCDFNAISLVEKCKALESVYLVKNWYGCVSNLVMIKIVYDYNQGRYPEDKFHFVGAPLASEESNSGYYLPKLVELGKVGQERLSAGASPVLVNALEEMEAQGSEMLNQDIAQWPLLAALCYPLTHLMMVKGNRAVKPKPYDYGKYGSLSWQR